MMSTFLRHHQTSGTDSDPSSILCRGRSRVWAGALLLGAAALIGTGCPGEGSDGTGEDEGVEDLTIVVEADKSRILQQEQELVDQQQTVEEERDRLAQERKRISEQLATLSKKDRKQRAKLESEEKRLTNQEKQLKDQYRSYEKERNKLEKEKTQLLEKISQLTRTKGGLTIEQRETRLAQREKELAKREARLAERTKALAQTQADAAQTLKEINALLAELKGSGMTRTVVVNNTAPTGSGRRASRGTVQRLNQQIKAKMTAKGILSEDLPPTAKEQQAAFKRTHGSKDYDGAQDALEQLDQIVSGLKVNHDFVQAKFARINRSAKGKLEKLDDKKQKRVLSLLDDVSDAFSDGRYDRANKKINQIYALIEGS